MRIVSGWLIIVRGLIGGWRWFRFCWLAQLRGLFFGCLAFWLARTVAKYPCWVLYFLVFMFTVVYRTRQFILGVAAWFPRWGQWGFRRWLFRLKARFSFARTGSWTWPAIIIVTCGTAPAQSATGIVTGRTATARLTVVWPGGKTGSVMRFAAWFRRAMRERIAAVLRVTLNVKPGCVISRW